MANTPLSSLPVVTGVNPGDYTIVMRAVVVGGNSTFVDSRVTATQFAASLSTTFNVGTVTTLAYNMPATVTVTGSPPSQTLNFGIPQGNPGAGGAGSGNVNTQGSVTAGAVTVYADNSGTNISAGVPATVRTTLGAAKNGANSDITSITGLTTPLTTTQGGTGTTSTTGTGSNVFNTSPTLSSPIVGTQTAGDNSTKAASTAYVATAVSGATAGYAPLASPNFTGSPTAPTVSGSTDNSTFIATTAFVQAVLSGGGGGYAPINNPTFTGTPAGPTASTATNTTQLATTAYVQSNLTLYATLVSPAFTGNPSAPTQLTTDNTTKIATTAWVNAFMGADAAGLCATGYVSTGLGGTCNVVYSFGTSSTYVSAGWRNDGTSLYLVSTAVGSGGSSYNSFRPFTYTLSTGAVSIDGTGAGVTFGGKITVGTGTSTFGARPTFNGATPWDSANLTPSNYALLNSSPVFVGQVYTNNGYPVYSTANLTPSTYALTDSTSSGQASIGVNSSNTYRPRVVWNGTSIQLCYGVSGAQGVSMNTSGQYPGVAYGDGGGITYVTPCDNAHLYLMYYGSYIGMTVDSSNFHITSTVVSDRRLKDIEGSVTGASAAIEALNPVSYEYNAKAKQHLAPNGKRIGFIADEISKVLPTSTYWMNIEVIPGEGTEKTKHHEDQYEHLDNDASIQLCALLVASQKEMMAEIKDLKSRLATLEAR